MALEAAHLYRYAELGVHMEDGGLLMRANIHTLFDLGLITIKTESGLIHIDDEIRSFESYGELHLQPVKQKLSRGQHQWLKLHWAQHQ